MKQCFFVKHLYLHSLLLLSLMVSVISWCGNRIVPAITEGAQPMEYRTSVYLDQNFPIPITGSGDLTITRSGWYALSNSITGDIIIEADCVQLDCHGYAINGQIYINANYVTIDMQSGWVYTATPAKDGIKIANSRHDIMITGGTIGPVTQYGIYVDGQSGRCYNITIQNMKIVNFTYSGLHLIYTDNSTIAHCTISSTLSAASVRGLYLVNATKVVVHNCSVKGLINQDTSSPVYCYGFETSECSDIYFYDCQALEISVSSAATEQHARGFECSDSNRIIYEQCIAENISAATTAFGIYLATSNECIIEQCNCNDIQAFQARGIFINNATNSVCIDNLIGNVLDISGTGYGIVLSDESNNSIAKNVVYNCSTSNYSGVGNIQSGYRGTHFMYNVALPLAP